MHIDELFGEPGQNAIDFDLIEAHFKDLMRVAISVREGQLSSSLLLRRLRSGSKRNAHYTAFREVGRVVRTVQLLKYRTDPAMRRRVTAATNKVEALSGFSEWVRFGNSGVLTDNEPAEQEKALKFNSLLTNAVFPQGPQCRAGVLERGEPVARDGVGWPPSARRPRLRRSARVRTGRGDR